VQKSRELTTPPESPSRSKTLKVDRNANLIGQCIIYEFSHKPIVEETKQQEVEEEEENILLHKDKDISTTVKR